MVGPQQEKFEIYDSKSKSLVKYYNTTAFAETMRYATESNCN